MPHSNMPPPSKSYTDGLMVKRVINKGNSKSGRDRVNRQNTNMLGRSYSPAGLMLAHHQGKSGIYTQGAIHLSRVIEGMNKPTSQSLAKAAAIKKEKEAVTQRKKTLLKNLQPQNAGYKKPKATPKKK
jgi:hypothetical protein